MIIISLEPGTERNTEYLFYIFYQVLEVCLEKGAPYLIINLNISTLETPFQIFAFGYLVFSTSCSVPYWDSLPVKQQGLATHVTVHCTSHHH